MKPQFRAFVFGAAFLLAITAFAKLVSASIPGAFLDAYEPIFRVRYRYLLVATAVLELSVAIYCVRSKSVHNVSVCLLTLASAFFVYRTGLWWLGYKGPCSCLGTLDELLHFNPRYVDIFLKGIIGYLFVGSGIALFSAARGGPQPTLP